MCHNGEGALNVNSGLACSVRFPFFILRCRSLAADGYCTKMQALATVAPKRVVTSGARESGNHGHPCLQKQHVNDRRVLPCA